GLSRAAPAFEVTPEAARLPSLVPSTPVRLGDEHLPHHCTGFSHSFRGTIAKGRGRVKIPLPAIESNLVRASTREQGFRKRLRHRRSACPSTSHTGRNQTRRCLRAYQPGAPSPAQGTCRPRSRQSSQACSHSAALESLIPSRPRVHSPSP